MKEGNVVGLAAGSHYQRHLFEDCPLQRNASVMQAGKRRQRLERDGRPSWSKPRRCASNTASPRECTESLP